MTEYNNPLLNEREATHGDWRHTAEIAQTLKECWRYSALTTSQREALDMIATKIARILSGNADEPDHWRDIAGYATLAAEHLVHPRASQAQAQAQVSGNAEAQRRVYAPSGGRPLGGLD